MQFFFFLKRNLRYTFVDLNCPPHIIWIKWLAFQNPADRCSIGSLNGKSQCGGNNVSWTGMWASQSYTNTSSSMQFTELKRVTRGINSRCFLPTFLSIYKGNIWTLQKLKYWKGAYSKIENDHLFTFIPPLVRVTTVNCLVYIIPVHFAWPCKLYAYLSVCIYLCMHILFVSQWNFSI